MFFNDVIFSNFYDVKFLIFLMMWFDDVKFLIFFDDVSFSDFYDVSILIFFQWCNCYCGKFLIFLIFYNFW